MPFTPTSALQTKAATSSLSAVRQVWQVFQEYVDTGFSGATASRPRLDQLLRVRGFGAGAHYVRSIQELASLGIRFLSPTESIPCLSF